VGGISTDQRLKTLAMLSVPTGKTLRPGTQEKGSDNPSYDQFFSELPRPYPIWVLFTIFGNYV
jgi:hypothetical protein